MADYKFRIDLTNELVEVLSVLENALEHIDDALTTESVKLLLKSYYHDDYLAEQLLEKEQRDREQQERDDIMSSNLSSAQMIEALKMLNAHPRRLS